jgi:hypothetical protein
VSHSFAIPLLAALQAASQPAPQEPKDPKELQRRYDELLKAKFLQTAPWFLEYDEALADAKKTGKLVFAYFTRSSAPSQHAQQFEESVLASPAFPAWIAPYVPYCHVTTRIPGRKHDDLLDRVGGEGFPHIVFMDGDGDVLAIHETALTLEELSRTVANAKEPAALKAKAAAGDPQSQFQWLLFQIDGATIPFADADARARRLELTSEQRARLDLKLIDLEAIGIIHAIRDPSEVAAGVRRLLAMVEKKRIPTNDQIFGVVLSVILRDGDDRKDIKTFEAGLQIAKDRLGSNRSYKPILDSIAKRLEELKAEIAKPADAKTGEKPKKNQ